VDAKIPRRRCINLKENERTFGYSKKIWVFSDFNEVTEMSELNPDEELF